MTKFTSKPNVPTKESLADDSGVEKCLDMEK